MSPSEPNQSSHDAELVSAAPAEDRARVAGHGTAGHGSTFWTRFEGSPPWVSGMIWRLAIAVMTLVVVWWLARRLSSLLVVIFISTFLSFAIEPAVNSLERRGVRRGIGTGLVFLAVFLGVAGFGIAMGQVIAQQITDLVAEAPDRIGSLETWLQDNIDNEIDLGELQNNVSESGELQSRVTDFAGGLVDFGGALIRAIFDLFTIGLFTFYLVAEGPKLRRTICSLLPPAQQRQVLDVWNIGTAKTGGYLVSRMVLVVIAFGAHWLAFELMGLRFALVLAIWVGLLSQFVPVVGTYVAAVLPILIALADEPITALWVALFMLVWQQIENYIIGPRVTSETMAVHPAVAFGSVVAGTAILGAVGAFLALPVSATLQGFISSYVSRYSVDLDTELGAATDGRDLNGVEAVEVTTDDATGHPRELSAPPAQPPDAD